MKILETERLILREIVEADAEFILDLLNQPSFIKYIGDRNVRNLEQAREFIKNRYRASYAEHGFGLYVVELKAETRALASVSKSALTDVRAAVCKNPPIGICGFVKRDNLPEADIGFAFLSQFEQKGFAFESASAVLRYGRENLKLGRVLAITSQDNESSGRLLKKLGFKFEVSTKMSGDDTELKLFSSDI